MTGWNPNAEALNFFPSSWVGVDEKPEAEGAKGGAPLLLRGSLGAESADGLNLPSLPPCSARAYGIRKGGGSFDRVFQICKFHQNAGILHA